MRALSLSPQKTLLARYSSVKDLFKARYNSVKDHIIRHAIVASQKSSATVARSATVAAKDLTVRHATVASKDLVGTLQ